jgi:hypothetical protein
MPSYHRRILLYERCHHITEGFSSMNDLDIIVLKDVENICNKIATMATNAQGGVPIGYMH